MARDIRHRLKSEINVVPYIDVMLVLLIIFMVTAPLLTQGIEVDLPDGAAEALPPEESEPLVVSVDSEGRLYLNIGDNPDAPLDEETLLQMASAIFRQNPETRAVVKGDTQANWGSVALAMSLMQRAGGGKQLGILMDPPAATDQ